MVAIKAKASGTPAKLEATPGEGQHESTRTAGQTAQDHGISQQEAKEGPAEGGDQADAQAGLVGVA